MRAGLSKILYVFIALTFVTLISPAQVTRASSMSGRALIVQRLNYLADAPNFSPDRPLTQTQLMDLALDLGSSGDYPADLKDRNPSAAEPNADGYVTRGQVREFLSGLVGQDLKIWKYDSTYDPAQIDGDNLTWIMNRSNTMALRPQVHLRAMRTVDDTTVEVTFRITSTDGIVSDSTVAKITGAGTATLHYSSGVWTVSSWMVKPYAT